MKHRSGVQRLTQSPHFDRLNISIDPIAAVAKKNDGPWFRRVSTNSGAQPDGLLIDGTNCSAIRGKSASSQ
jgi:hypothetical protein